MNETIVIFVYALIYLHMVINYLEEEADYLNRSERDCYYIFLAQHLVNVKCGKIGYLTPEPKFINAGSINDPI